MSTYQKLQLDDISYEYERFRENQLLTHNQLNRFIDFFEDQDRITRTCLMGVGLVCGLTARWSKGTLYINKGCAVTTDGDLLVVEKNTAYRFFKPYDNRRKGTDEPIYDPFFPPAASGEQMPLWEMRTAKDDDTGVPAVEIAKFEDVSGRPITDMVALLYLESYVSDPDDCTAIDCNQLGQRQRNKINVLLVHPDDVDAIINGESDTEIIVDDIYRSYYDAYTSYFALPELKAKRLILTPSHTDNLAALKNGYEDIVKSGIPALADAIAELYTLFKFILDQTTFFDIDAIRKKIADHGSSPVKPYQVQYLYDFYKDLLDGYNELRNTIYNAVYICCPNKHAFPKHIMLGIVNDALGPRPPQYRHGFYASPITSRGKSYLSVARSMFNRLNNLVAGFAIPQSGGAIRVTPSVTPDKTLEWRAIPFYYNNAPLLAENWSYYRRMRGTDTQLLSYHFADSGVASPVSTPLDFDIDKNNFFRIEGHQGSQLNDALRRIVALKDDKNLPFDVVAIRLGDTQDIDINFDDYSFYFEDLNVVLNTWIAAQQCLFSDAAKYLSAIKVSEQAAGRKDVSAARTEPVPRQHTGYVGTYFYQRYVKNDSFWQDNVANDEGTVGSMMLAIEGHTTRPADSVILEVQRIINGDAGLAQLPQDDLELHVTIPALVIARLNDVLNYEPFVLEDLNDASLQPYRDALGTLAEEVTVSIDKVTALYEKNPEYQRTLGMEYLRTLQALKNNSCAAKSIAILTAEIEKRKQEIADRLTLGTYASQHKGLEHWGGVERGGTFVLLYANAEDAGVDAAAPDPVAATDRLRAYIHRYEREYAFKRKKRPEMSVFYSEDVDYFLTALAFNAKHYDVVQEMENYLSRKIKKGTSKRALQLQVRKLVERFNLIMAKMATQPKGSSVNHVVVADFCLPYRCCSDIPPMTFIIPPEPTDPEPPQEPEYALSLSVKEVCGNNDSTFVFTKMPEDGIVKASPSAADAAIVNDGDVSFVLPTAIDPDLYGKQITFTINDQETDCTLVVFSPLDASFEVVGLQREKDTLRFSIVLKKANHNASYRLTLNDGQYGEGEVVPDTDGVIHVDDLDIANLVGSEMKAELTALPSDKSPCARVSASQSFRVPSRDEPPVDADTCLTGVLNDVRHAIKALDATRTDIKDKALKERAADLNARYEAVAKEIDENDSIKQINDHLKRIAELHAALMEPATYDGGDAEQVALLRMLALQLALLVVRCVPTLPATQLAVLMEMLNAHIKFLPGVWDGYADGLKRRYEEMIRSFMDAGVNKVKQLHTRLGLLLNIVVS